MNNFIMCFFSALYGLSNADLGTPDPNPAWSPGSSPGSPSHNHTEASVFNYNVPPKITVPHSLSMSRYNKFRHGTSSGLLGNVYFLYEKSNFST